MLALVYVWGRNSAAAGELQRSVDAWVRQRVPDLGGGSGSGADRTVDATATWALVLLRWSVVGALLAWKRWRHLAVFIVSVIAVAGIAAWFPTAGVEGTTDPRHPSIAAAGLAVTLTAVVYGLAPRGSARRIAAIVAASIGLAVGLVLLTTGRATFVEIVIGLTIGAAVPIVGFRVFAPESVFPVSYRKARTAHLEIGPRRTGQIRVALEEQLGLRAATIEPFGLEGSGASTPLRIMLADGETCFGKLYAVNHLRADRWYKLGRTVLYGALEDERSFNSVRRMVEYEDHMLRYLRDHGVASAPPIGFVELTPEREYLLVTGFIEGAVELVEAEVDDEVIRSGIRVVDALWRAGVAHRDIKPSNVLVHGRDVVLIDTFFCQVRPSTWRRSVDLADMMLCLALRSDARTVYRIALERFSPEEIADAFAATHGVTIPSQLRSLLAADPRDLHGGFTELAPARTPIRVQRWSLRRIAVIGVLGGGIVLALSLALENLETSGFAPP